MGQKRLLWVRRRPGQTKEVLWTWFQPSKLKHTTLYMLKTSSKLVSLVIWTYLTSWWKDCERVSYLSDWVDITLCFTQHQTQHNIGHDPQWLSSLSKARYLCTVGPLTEAMRGLEKSISSDTWIVLHATFHFSCTSKKKIHPNCC